jgi:hypothetical protein
MPRLYCPAIEGAYGDLQALRKQARQEGVAWVTLATPLNFRVMSNGDGNRLRVTDKGVILNSVLYIQLGML